MNRCDLIKRAAGFRYLIECSEMKGYHTVYTVEDGLVVDLFDDDNFDDNDIEELLYMDSVTIGSCCNTYYLLNPKVKANK